MSVNTTQTGGRRPYYLCKEVSEACPVSGTVLGYYPNKGVNAFLAVGFGVAAVVTLYFGVRKKTFGYAAFIVAGCLLEMAGYAARVPLATNPWNSSAFQTQICAIILAPTLICISIYLTLKHVCVALNPALSRVRPPRLYPFIFVPADVSCLLVQAIGGSLAAAAGYKSPDLLRGGNRAIIAGIVLQLVVLAIFGGFALDYFLRVRKYFAGNIEGMPPTEESLRVWNDTKFRRFIYAVTGAYSGILIRCIYRVAEMAGGWGNHVMQDEPSFIVLEGFCILIPVLLLAFFPPGELFPQMAAASAEKRGCWPCRRSRKATSTSAGEESQELESGPTADATHMDEKKA